MAQIDNPIRVVLADRHALCREGLARVLEPEPDMRVIGGADDRSGAITLARTLSPGVVVLGLELPDCDLERAILLIRSSSPGTKILVLSTRDTPASVQCALNAGAHGYSTKDISGFEFVSAIRAMARNAKRFFVSTPLEGLAGYGEKSSDPLTVREAEVLGLAAEALTNLQIAGRLGIAESTVRRHLTNAYTRLSATSRIDAINKATADGIIATPMKMIERQF